MTDVALIDYGAGNIRSVTKAMQNMGLRVSITNEAYEIRSADALILPGVGAFREAMKNLAPIKNEILDKVSTGTPLLGICLGLQLIFTRSYEFGVTDGLNLVPGEVVKLPRTVKLPHIGWNRIKIVNPNFLLDGVPDDAYMYFVHSYVVSPNHPETVLATASYGVSFPSVIAADNIVATQFHPEKSSGNGLKIIENFVRWIRR